MSKKGENTPRRMSGPGGADCCGVASPLRLEPGDGGAAAGGRTFVAYLPALRGGYVWDDNLHLLDNPVLQPGGLAKAWVPG